MATLPKISKENADAVSGAVTVMANGTNGLNNAGNTGSFVPNPTVSTGTDVVIGQVSWRSVRCRQQIWWLHCREKKTDF